MSDSKKVLIGDGIPKTVPELKPALAELGYDVVPIPDATYVLSLALRHRPAAVILGAQLPAGGAQVALRRLRGSVHTAAIPVIALTAPGSQKQALLNAGADECLDLPVTEADVVAVVRKRLGLSRAVREAPTEILRDPERLAALVATGLLDSKPDESLDVLTRMAAETLGVPVVLVSLVDGKRQFCKSQVGLPTPYDVERQTPLSHSFCQWVVSSQEELVVSDARVHPVLRGNDAVADLGVVAYAGIPLTAALRQTIGSFCAIDGSPRDWLEADIAALRDFAQVVEAQSILNMSQARGLGPASGNGQWRAAVQAAGRGFLCAARLLRRGRPALNESQRADLLGVIERQSHQLIDLAEPARQADGSAADALLATR